MALFRKFFYRKPPDGLLEISDRVYVFDCCFTTDILEDEEYKVYLGGIVGQLRDHFSDASYMVFNFREGEHQSQIANVLCEYEMTVMDYPRQYEGCPLLSMEMIHHFLRSSESWLTLMQQNVILMHCEQGGWPILAFMLAALLIYRKQCMAEQKTLSMIYRQAPRELVQLMSPLDPLPSQLRYLQYVSRRNLGSEWPPLDRELTLDCIIIRSIPNIDGEGGCRPIFRIYGQDPLMPTDRTPKVLFSTPKSKLGRYYKQSDCELVKIDIHCHAQGDVVLECVSLDNDLDRESMMFRVMFNTAFIRSNILMLNRDDIDILWNAKDQFPKDFRAEVIFSEMDAPSSTISFDPLSLEDKDGLPEDAFDKVQEFFSNVDWLDQKTDIANLIQHISASNMLQENFDKFCPRSGGRYNLLLESALEKVKDISKLKQSEVASPTFGSLAKLSSHARRQSIDVDSVKMMIEPAKLEVTPQELPSTKPSMDSHSNGKEGDGESAALQDNLEQPSEKSLLTPSSDENETKKKMEPQEIQVALQRSPQSKIISQRVVHHASLSAPVSLQGSPVSLSRYNSAPSAVGITALLQDHVASKSEEAIHAVTLPLSTSSSAPALVNISKPLQQSHLSTALPPSPPPLPSAPSPITSNQVTTEVTSSQQPGITSPVKDQSTSIHSPPMLSSSEMKTAPSDPPPPIPHLSGATPSLKVKNLIQTPPPPTPPPPMSHPVSVALSSPTIKNSFPPPPPPLPSSALSTKNSFSAPPPPPPPSTMASAATGSPPKVGMPPTPPPPPPHSAPPPPPLVHSAPPPPPVSSPGLASSALPLPPPPPVSSPGLASSAPPPPPPPVSSPGLASSAPPPPPPPVSSPGLAPFAPPPPPPPVSSSGSVSSAPPPPPPPSTGSKVSVSNNPAPTPPVPPPPGSVSPQIQSGSNGNIPAIPGPPSVRGLSRTAPKGQAQARKANLKPYHWLKLTRAMQGSLWAEAQHPDEASKTPQFDISELESLFSAAAPSSLEGSKSGKSKRAAGSKSEKVQLIELRRAYNCEIMLTKVKIPLSDLMSYVLALDDSALDVDQVENLIKFSPTKEEMESLKNYKGDRENLGRCEQFFLELMKVPRVESKLRVFAFKIQFSSLVSELRNSLNVVNSAAEEVRNSVKLKRVMQTILSLGNALNHGTARGSAIGFRLDSLLKLTDTRARDTKMTLMHYLCKVLAEKLPEVLDFPKDLISLEAATKIQLKYLAEELQAISKGLEKVVQELTASENDGQVSEAFCKILKGFLSFAEGEVRSLASLYSYVGRNADALALYFGEDPARCPFEQVVSTLLHFVRMFVRAHDENCKQLEMERKKAQKEAENEKLKMENQSKDSEETIHSAIKSAP